MSNDLYLPPNELLASFNQTDLSCVHKSVRLAVAIKSRIRGLETYYTKWHSGDSFMYAHLQQVTGTLTTLLNDLCSFSPLLVKNSIIANTQYDETKYQRINMLFKEYPATLKDHCRVIFGTSNFVKFQKSDPNPFLKYVFDTMARGALLSRKAEIERRVMLDIDNFIVKEGWYCVFNTLTVAPSYYEQVFKQGSLIWRQYVRNVDSMFARAAYGSVRGGVRARRRGLEFHRYFAVTEKGTEGGRLHVHVLHFFKTMPKSFYDPNRGRAVANYQLINGMRGRYMSIPRCVEKCEHRSTNRRCIIWKPFWEYGFDFPVAVRYGESDAFSKSGWTWPEAMKSGKFVPLESGTPDRIVGYVAKYLQKRYNEVNNENVLMGGAYLWRTRISRKMGLESVKTLCHKMTRSQLETYLTLRPALRIQNRLMPKRLTRRSALRSLFERIKKNAPVLVLSLVKTLKSPKVFWRELVNTILNPIAFSLPSAGNLILAGLENLVDSDRLESVKVQHSLAGVPYAIV